MKRRSVLKDFKMGKHFILTQPTSVDEDALEELFDVDDYGWREKSRRLQIRRWRKLKHYLA